MASWLTTHYPHPVPDHHPWHVYLQEQHRDAVEGIQTGDLVFFYEFAAQKPVKGGLKTAVGRQGIVRVAKVSGPIYGRDAVIEYQGGETKNWSWGVPTNDADIEGFVGREKMCEILGYKPSYQFRGFGGGTGVKRLDEVQAVNLLREFKSRAKGS